MNPALSRTSHSLPPFGLPQLIGLGLTLLALHLSTRYSYLLFHSLVEIVRIVVLSGIFVLAWHSKRWIGNAFLLLIGTAALFIAGLETLHALAYKGLGVFPGADANLPTQLWVAFRYVESFSYLAAAALMHRQLNPNGTAGAYCALTLGLGLAIFTGRFPDCFVEGRGLTDFKIGSEYVITGVFVASLLLIYRRRGDFDRSVLRLVVGSIIAGIFAELAFTRYANVYGAANEVGHYLLLVSAYLLYRAVLVTGIAAPFDLLFRGLKQKESELEAHVAERTAALRQSEAQANAFSENSPSVIYLTDLAGRHTLVNAAFERLVGKPRREIVGRTVAELLPADVAEVIERNRREVLADRRPSVITQYLRIGDSERIFESIGFPIVDAAGEVVGAGGIATDVTEHRLAEERYGTIIKTSMDAFVIIDQTGRFVEVNQAACELSGYERERLLTMAVADVEATMAASEVAAQLRSLAAAGFGRFDSRWRHRDGGIRDVEVSVNFLGSLAGGRFFAFIRDITERKEAIARIEYLAHFDGLTGLPNKRLFQERFRHVAAAAERGGQPLALLYLDLDNFKDINDTLGHVVGDLLLNRMSERLVECVRGIGSAGRNGGDEFLVLLDQVDDEPAIVEVVNNVLQRLAAPLVVDEHELVSTVSIGAALFPRDGKDFDTLFKKADTAMFEAKEGGRNAYRFFDEQMNADALDRLNLVGRLRGAIERHELILHYQPQIDLDSGAVIGAEALLRWQHPELGLMPPGRFIPLAEDSGLIVPIGAWVIDEACRQAAAWRQAGLPEIVVAVNLSAVQFRSPDLFETVTNALLKSGLDAACLELELTESILIRDTESVLEKVRRLKTLGLKLSIDDFGTGYSSLAYLKRFAVDKLKIDQSFVRDMDRDPDDSALVRAIIQMARSLGLKTIAEGVEHGHLVDQLRVYHCDEAQGYFYARPMPAAAFAAYLASAMPPASAITRRPTAPVS